MGAYPQAEEEFRAAVRIDPGMADGWLGLHALRVDTTTALLRMFRAPGTLRRAARPAPPHPQLLVLAGLVGAAGAGEPARSAARARLALAGRPPCARAGPGARGAAAGRRRPQVRFLHACRAYLVKDWEQLVRHTEPLVDDPLLGIEAGLFGGMARVRLEMYGQAEPLLSAALMRCRSEQPQRKELRYWLARAHEGTGRSAAALPLYRAVHRVDPAFMDTSARLAAIAEGDGIDGRRRERPRGDRARRGRRRTCSTAAGLDAALRRRRTRT